jgi:hypothetical protein
VDAPDPFPMNALDLTGHCCTVAPIERHPFRPSNADPFLCGHCHRPRALHSDPSFIPRPSPLFRRTETLSEDLGANYRGPHPRWTKPGMHLRPDPDELDFARRQLRRQLLPAGPIPARPASQRLQPNRPPGKGLELPVHQPIGSQGQLEPAPPLRCTTSSPNKIPHAATPEG